MVLLSIQWSVKYIHSFKLLV